jgi:hypothetical protein
MIFDTPSAHMRLRSYEKVREVEITYAVDNWGSVQHSRSFQHKFDLFSEGQLPRGKDIIKQLLTNVRPKQAQSPKRSKQPIVVSTPFGYGPTGGWANWAYGQPGMTGMALPPPPIQVVPAVAMTASPTTSGTHSPVLNEQPLPGPNEAGPGPGPLVI